jgi:hypothetical protein
VILLPCQTNPYLAPLNFSCEPWFHFLVPPSRFCAALWDTTVLFFLFCTCASPNTDQLDNILVVWKSLQWYSILFSCTYSSSSTKNTGEAPVINYVRISFHSSERKGFVFPTPRLIYKSVIPPPSPQSLRELKNVFFFRKTEKGMSKWRLLRDVNDCSFNFHTLELLMVTLKAIKAKRTIITHKMRSIKARLNCSF